MKILAGLFVLLLSTSLSAGFFGDNSQSNTLTSPEDEVVINDIPLSYNIKIVGSTSRFVYDLLSASVTIKSLSDSQHELEYKFIWYDETGFEMGKHLSKWKHIRIDSKDTIVIQDVAFTSKVDSFKFYIRDRQN
jgi:uncharacterized protein YcfL